MGSGVEIVPLRKGGFGYLKNNLPKFLEMAQRNTVLMITDLDSGRCAPTLRSKWLGRQLVPDNFIFRVAVREIESWIMADRAAFAEFLRVARTRIPRDLEQVADPKEFLLKLAKNAPRDLKEDLLPRKGAAASQGLGYNDVLTGFVHAHWSCERAMECSESLSRAYQRLCELGVR